MPAREAMVVHRRRPRACVTRVRLTPTRRARSARLATSPASSIRLHSRTRAPGSARARLGGLVASGWPKSAENAVNRSLLEEQLGSNYLKPFGLRGDQSRRT